MMTAEGTPVPDHPSLGADMRTNRTASAAHIRWRDRVLARAQQAGQTTCPLCGVELAWGEYGLPNSVEADHIIPVRWGGRNELSNGQAVCRTCNRSKGGREGPLMPVSRQTRANLVEW